jgi:hypothetical protein
MIQEYTPTEELGALAGRVIHEMEMSHKFYDDPITLHYGCGGELGAMVTRGAIDRIVRMLDDAGLTVQEFIDLVESRVSTRWAHDYIGEFEQLAMTYGLIS